MPAVQPQLAEIRAILETRQPFFSKRQRAQIKAGEFLAVLEVDETGATTTRPFVWEGDDSQ